MEPVAWMWIDSYGERHFYGSESPYPPDAIPLYLMPWDKIEAIIKIAERYVTADIKNPDRPFLKQMHREIERELWTRKNYN